MLLKGHPLMSAELEEARQRILKYGGQLLEIAAAREFGVVVNPGNCLVGLPLPPSNWQRFGGWKLLVESLSRQSTAE